MFSVYSDLMKLFLNICIHQLYSLSDASLPVLRLWNTEACVSCRACFFASINYLLSCLFSFVLFFKILFNLHPKAIFRKIWWLTPSWLETSDPHGRICMDLHLKANQGTNSLPISPRWGLNCEQEAQMKDKNERRHRWWASVVEGEQQPRCQRRQITEHQRASARIPAVFNRTGSLIPTLQPGLCCGCCRLINAVFPRQSVVEEVCLITNVVAFEEKWECRPMAVRFYHANGHASSESPVFSFGWKRLKKR